MQQLERQTRVTTWIRTASTAPETSGCPSTRSGPYFGEASWTRVIYLDQFAISTVSHRRRPLSNDPKGAAKQQAAPTHDVAGP